METRIEQARQAYLKAEAGDKLWKGLDLADNLIQAGRFPQADELLDEIARLAAKPREAAAVMRRRGESLFRQSRFDQAYAVLGEAMSLLSEEPGEMELFYIYRGLGWVFVRQGYMERARSFCEGARGVLELQPDQGDRRVQDAWSTLYHSLALIEGGEGRKEEALAYYRKELEILERAGERSKMVPLYINMGNIHYGQGRLAKALEMQLEALSILEDDGDDLLRTIIYNNLGGLYLAVGDAVKSKDYYRQQLELNREVKYAIGDAFALAGLGRAYRMLGDGALAEENYQRALGLARSLQGKSKEASILAELVELKLDRGDTEGAQQALDQAAVIMSETEEREPTRYAVLRAQIWAARVPKLHPVEGRALLGRTKALLDKALGSESVLASEEVVSGKELELTGWQLASSVRMALGDQQGAAEAIARAMRAISDFTEGFSHEQLELFWKRKDMVSVRALSDEINRASH
jgi:tetratricopeptide (TPR) repeat protein